MVYVISILFQFYVTRLLGRTVVDLCLLMKRASVLQSKRTKMNIPQKISNHYEDFLNYLKTVDNLMYI